MDRSKLEKQARQLATVAHHEAGHAVAAFHCDIEIKSVTIIPGSGTDGLHQSTPYFSDEELENITLPEMTGELQLSIENYAFITLTGPWAQKTYNPKGFRKAHLEGDWHSALRLLSRVREDNEALELYVQLIDIDARNFVRDKFNWGVIRHLAGVMLNQPTMTGDEVHKAIMDSYKID